MKHRSFRPLAGWGLFLVCYTGRADLLVSVPLRGVGCFVRVWDRPNSYDEKFPSPCGVWVVSMWPTKLLGRCDLVSVPLRGVGCFEADRMEIQGEKLMFPSPCGVWVVSNHS